MDNFDWDLEISQLLNELYNDCGVDPELEPECIEEKLYKILKSEFIDKLKKTCVENVEVMKNEEGSNIINFNITINL